MFLHSLPGLESVLNSSDNNDLRKVNNILELSAREEYIWLERNLEKKASIEKILSNRLYGNVRFRSKRRELDFNYALLFRGDSEGNTDFIPLDEEGNFEIISEELSYGNDEYLYVKALPQKSGEIVLLIKDPLEGMTSILETVRFKYPSRDFNLKDQKLELPTFDRNMILLSEFIVRAKRFEDAREKFISELAERAKLDFNSDYVCEKGTYLNCPICGHTEIKPEEGKVYAVFRNPEKILNRYHNGFHFIITKEDSFERIQYEFPKYTDEELMKLYNMTRTKGFFVGAGFLAKEYPDQASKNDPESDYRNTLSWNPYLFTDKEGKAVIEFYTSDIMSIFTGNFEALSADGRMGKVSFDFVVE